jgi:hypothetical protein
MKFKLFSILLLVTSTVALAQNKVTLSGYIKDSETGEELIGATILLKGTQNGVATNAYGFYSLTVNKGDYTLIVNYIGYNAKVIEKRIETSESYTITLDAASQELNEIVITGEADNLNITNTQMSIVKLSPKQVKEFPAVLGEPDIIRSFQLLPGVTAVADGAAGFNVRGGSADQNLILLDEATIYNSSHLFGLYSVANPDAVKDVNLYKGGIPARYGGRLSSVMDIRQREGNSNEFNGEAGIGLISARVLVEGPLVKEKSSYMIAGRRSYGDLFLPLIDNNSTANFYDLNTKVNYTINEKNRLFLSGYFGRDKFSLGSIFNSEWGNATATLRWNHLFNDKLFANFSAIYSNYDYSLDQLTTGAQFNSTSKIITLNTKADFSYFINNNTQFEYGFDAKAYRFEPGKIKPIKGSAIANRNLDNQFANEFAGYMSLDKTIKKLSINIGLRYSAFIRNGEQTIPIYENNQPLTYNSILGRYENGKVIDNKKYNKGDNISTFNNFEPRISSTLILNDRTSIKASYNRIYQYLHLISNTTAPAPTDVWAPSGPYIKPQESDQFALGYFKNFTNNKFELSLEGFYKKMNNLVEYVDGADLISNNTIETELLAGRGRSYGLELLVKKNSGKLTGWVSYTYSRAERQVKGLTNEDPGINNGKFYAANFDKPHNLSVVGTYKFNDRISLSSNFILTTGIPSTYPVGRYEFAGIVVPHFTQRNQERLPAYHRLDVSLTIKGKKVNWKNGGHEWVFGLYNLYNRANATSIYFVEDPENLGKVRAYKSYLLPILPSVTYNFKF